MKYIFIAFFTLLLFGCKQYVQVFDTKSTSKNPYVFENDTLTIEYSLWDGSVDFRIFNKLNVPVYIDWSRSSLINNGEKINYWNDKTESVGMSMGNPFINPYYQNSVLQMAAIQKSKTTRPERITFIPPKSHYMHKGLKLPNGGYDDFSSNAIEKNKVQLSYKLKKSTWVYAIELDMGNTPLDMRNYLAISTSENVDRVVFVDNEVYVYRIRLMDYKHFRGVYKKLENRKWGYDSQERTPYSFYTILPNDKSSKINKEIRDYNKSITKP